MAQMKGWVSFSGGQVFINGLINAIKKLIFKKPVKLISEST